MLEQKIMDDILIAKNENKKCNYYFIKNILKEYSLETYRIRYLNQS